MNMLRFPNRRTPWLTAWCLFLNTLLIINSSDNSQLPLRPLRDKPGSARAAGSPAGPTSAAPLAVSTPDWLFQDQRL